MKSDVLCLVPDRDLIEAARLAGERLESRLLLLGIREHLADGLAGTTWEHFADSAGGVHSALACPDCGGIWAPGHVCAGMVLRPAADVLPGRGAPAPDKRHGSTKASVIADSTAVTISDQPEILTKPG